MISDDVSYARVEHGIKKVPKKPGVYMLWRGPNTLLEVAETDSLLYALLLADEKRLEAFTSQCPQKSIEKLGIGHSKQNVRPRWFE